MSLGATCARTMPAELQIEDVANADIHDTEETLVALLEFALVKDLDGNDRRFLNHTAPR